MASDLITSSTTAALGFLRSTVAPGATLDTASATQLISSSLSAVVLCRRRHCTANVPVYLGGQGSYIYIDTHTRIYTYTYMYKYICFVCSSPCAQQKQVQGQGETNARA